MGSHETRPLPPGQRAKDSFPRYGLVRFASRWPKPPAEPRLVVRGDVEVPCEIFLSEMAGLPRREETADLHCVATWSRLDVRWGGYRFRDVYEELVLGRAKPQAGVRHLWIKGADGFSASLFLEDALADDVLLADALDGQPLPPEHGAPMRMVAPAHYGYKSVRHLCEIGLYRELRTGFGGPLVHPRGRVSAEERSRYLPGVFYRYVYRVLLPLTLRLHARLGAANRPARWDGT